MNNIGFVWLIPNMIFHTETQYIQQIINVIIIKSNFSEVFSRSQHSSKEEEECT